MLVAKPFAHLVEDAVLRVVSQTLYPRGQNALIDVTPIPYKLNVMKDILSKFSDWKPWAEWATPKLARPGLYMLAEFKDRDRPTRPSLSSNLIYVGETCDQSLHTRLYQFHRSAFKGKLGHSGGTTFATTYNTEENPPWLFISIAEVANEKPHASAYIRYAERAILWSYVQEHGEYPACNRK